MCAQGGSARITFSVALLVILRDWKQPKYPVTGKRLNKLSRVHTMKYCTALRTKYVCIFLCQAKVFPSSLPVQNQLPRFGWQALQDMLLSEKRKLWNHIYILILLIYLKKSSVYFRIHTMLLYLEVHPVKRLKWGSLFLSHITVQREVRSRVGGGPGICCCMKQQ